MCIRDICTVYEFMYIEHSLLVLWFYDGSMFFFRAKSRKMKRLVRMSVRRCTSIQAHKPFLETPNVREQADSPHYQQRIQSWGRFAKEYYPCVLSVSHWLVREGAGSCFYYDLEHL